MTKNTSTQELIDSALRTIKEDTYGFEEPGSYLYPPCECCLSYGRKCARDSPADSSYDRAMGVLDMAISVGLSPDAILDALDSYRDRLGREETTRSAAIRDYFSPAPQALPCL